MNYIFAFFILISIVFGFINGNLNSVTDAIWDGCKKTLDISIYLIGIMAFWMGILNPLAAKIAIIVAGIS